MQLAALFIATHLLFWSLLIAIQEVEVKLGRTPKRRPWSDPDPFPHFQDWRTATWGDLVGLTLVDGAGGFYLSHARFEPSIVVVFVAFVIGLIGTTLFHWFCLLPQHRPDAGTPRRRHLSYHGWAHAVYFFLQLSLVVLLFETLAEGYLAGIPMIVALLGGVIYSASFLLDVWTGRFAMVPIL